MALRGTFLFSDIFDMFLLKTQICPFIVPFVGVIVFPFTLQQEKNDDGLIFLQPWGENFLNMEKIALSENKKNMLVLSQREVSLSLKFN
jgi:hypothetical protein